MAARKSRRPRTKSDKVQAGADAPSAKLRDECKQSEDKTPTAETEGDSEKLATSPPATDGQSTVETPKTKPTRRGHEDNHCVWIEFRDPLHHLTIVASWVVQFNTPLTDSNLKTMSTTELAEFLRTNVVASKKIGDRDGPLEQGLATLSFLKARRIKQSGLPELWFCSTCGLGMFAYRVVEKLGSGQVGCTHCSPYPSANVSGDGVKDMPLPESLRSMKP